MTEVIKDNELWFEDGNLVLLVDGVYFKLYRELLVRQCGLFRDTLTFPHGSSSEEGSSVDKPIHIPDVTAGAFQQLVRHIFGLAASEPVDILTLEEEKDLLLVAHRLQANAIVLRMGRQLVHRLSPLARLFICTEYDLDGLLRAAIQDEQGRRERAAERAERRDLLPEARPEIPNQPGPTEGMLAEAFTEIVLDLDIKIPFHDPAWPLSPTWRLHLATARDQLATARRKSLDTYLVGCPQESWSAMDCLQLVHLPQTRQTDSALLKLWNENVSRGVRVHHLCDANNCRRVMPNEADERELIRNYLRSMT